MPNLSALAPVASAMVVVLVLAAFILPQAIRILREYQRGVVFRLGKLLDAKGPGLILLIPVVDRMVKMDLRVVTVDVARQEVMSRDNVPAAAMISKQPIALQLRFLQTMREIANEHNTTTFLPVPLDLFTPFYTDHGRSDTAL